MIRDQSRLQSRLFNKTIFLNKVCQSKQQFRKNLCDKLQKSDEMADSPILFWIIDLYISLFWIWNAVTFSEHFVAPGHFRKHWNRGKSITDQSHLTTYLRIV